MTHDEVKGKLTRLQMAKQNADVKFWLDTAKELADKMVIQSMNASGEEAIRAWGVQKGIGMVLMLEEIFASNLSDDARNKIIVPR